MTTSYPIDRSYLHQQSGRRAKAVACEKILVHYLRFTQKPRKNLTRIQYVSKACLIFSIRVSPTVLTQIFSNADIFEVAIFPFYQSIISLSVVDFEFFPFSHPQRLKIETRSYFVLPQTFTIRSGRKLLGHASQNDVTSDSASNR